MALNSSDIRDLLVKENNEFKRLHDQHQNYERRLDQLTKRSYLTTDEEFEISELKKKKLNLKDQMFAIIENYRVGPE